MCYYYSKVFYLQVYLLIIKLVPKISSTLKTPLMNFTITGYSTALFSTWFFVDELALLFDAGDGVSSGLTQKARKVKHAFISHADRDHLSGLVQFNQLNAREGYPIIYYPENSGSFPAMKAFTEAFDPHVKGTQWKAIKAFDKIAIKNDMFVEPIANNHVPVAENLSKSMSYRVFQTKRKLKSEFSNLSGNEIKNIIDQHGRDFTTEEIKTNILSYSGDTPVEDYERWNNCEVLIHEATFLGIGDENLNEVQGNRHSTLPQVMEMVSNIKIDKLILSHFSKRYSADQIDDQIRKLCKEYKIEIPVYRLLPGEIHRDIMNSDPIN